eukprot:7022872-Prymnesium_polylepis.2
MQQCHALVVDGRVDGPATIDGGRDGTEKGPDVARLLRAEENVEERPRFLHRARASKHAARGTKDNTRQRQLERAITGHVMR